MDLIPIMLLDSAHIQEEDAVFKKKRHKQEGRGLIQKFLSTHSMMQGIYSDQQ